jgi:hypothetical protein
MFSLGCCFLSLAHLVQLFGLVYFSRVASVLGLVSFGFLAIVATCPGIYFFKGGPLTIMVAWPLWYHMFSLVLYIRSAQSLIVIIIIVGLFV